MYVHNLEDSITHSSVDPVLRIRDIYPGFPDLGSRIQQQQQKRRGEKFVINLFF